MTRENLDRIRTRTAKRKWTMMPRQDEDDEDEEEEHEEHLVEIHRKRRRRV